MAAPLSTALLVAKFMGRERATPLAGAALHYHKRTAEGCEWRRGTEEGGSDLERKTLERDGRIIYVWRKYGHSILHLKGGCSGDADGTIYVTHLPSHSKPGR